MQIDELIRVTPEQTDRIERLANMMGESFLEEAWTQIWLSSLDELDVSDARKLEISRLIMRGDFVLGAPLGCVYCTPDEAACAGGYRKSELGNKSWEATEKEAFETVVVPELSPDEASLMRAQSERMEAISDFDWVYGDAQSRGFDDFIHFFCYGVDVKKRGSGAFRRLVDPFFALADTCAMPCYLETYRFELADLYAHFGYETVKVLRTPQFEAPEICMIRLPR